MLPLTAAAPKNCAWVQDVEPLHSKLERFCLRDMEILLQTHVEVGSTRGHRKSGVAHCPTGQDKDRYLMGKARAERRTSGSPRPRTQQERKQLSVE
jgi:hypothetical protein